MRKRETKLKTLTYMQTIVIPPTPPFTKHDFQTGKAIEFSLGWYEQKENIDKIVYYRGDDGNKYRIEKAMPTSDKKLATMMLLDAAINAIIDEENTQKVREEPKAYTHLKPEINIKEIITVQDDIKIIKDDEDFLFRIRKAERLR